MLKVVVYPSTGDSSPPESPRCTDPPLNGSAGTGQLTATSVHCTVPPWELWLHNILNSNCSIYLCYFEQYVGKVQRIASVPSGMPAEALSKSMRECQIGM